MCGGSPIPLSKTVSRICSWSFQVSRKIRKTASHSQKKASNHVSRKNCKGLIMFEINLQILLMFGKTYIKYKRSHKNTIITRMYLNMSVFYMFFFLDSVNRSNTMTIFEQFRGLLGVSNGPIKFDSCSQNLGFPRIARKN